MSLKSVHPKYTEALEDWTLVREVYLGERTVKNRGTVYLPATRGMILDGMTTGAIGREAYDAYKLRAVFPDYMRAAVQVFGGLLHQKPPMIELPDELEPLRQRASNKGESLEVLLRRINEEQLIVGRVGALLDLPVNPNQDNPLPYIALYATEAIRNWDDSVSETGEKRLNLVVLDETDDRRNAFDWKVQERYRILQLGDLETSEREGEARYFSGSFEGTDYDPTQMVTPLLRGVPMTQVPFVFINAKDLLSEPDAPPLAGLARMVLAIYRGEADYRQNLFMQGQETLVVRGRTRKPEEATLRVGTGAMIELDSDGDAKYIGITSGGLSEQRIAIENDRKRAETLAGQLIDVVSRSQAESGLALQTRIGAQTATLNDIALTGAAALEELLKQAAIWMGADPEKVKVTPNMEFADYDISGKELVEFMKAHSMGAPLSRKSIHAMLNERGVTKFDFETELKILEAEAKELEKVTPEKVEPAKDVPVKKEE